MKKNKKIFIILSAAVFFSFLIVEKSQAATCWTGSCKAACSSTEQISTVPGDGCGDGEVCCVPKSADVTNPCVGLADGIFCTTESGKAGTCQGGFCSADSNDDDDDDDDYNSTSTSGWNSSNLTQFGLPDAGGTGDAGYVIYAVLDWLLAVVGAVAIIALVVSGIQYFMVATDEKMMERAKKTMTAAIIGLIVALSGLVAIYAIDLMLRADSLF
ncbi:MAG: pilin [Parcubacteria group bacterium]|jgi:hypothetical protein